MPSEEIISSKDNPNIKLCQRLISSKKERYADGLFVLEGLRLVEDAIAHDAPIEQVLVTKSAAEKQNALLAQVDLKGLSIRIISNELGAKISATEQTQGVFAVCRFLPCPALESALKPDGHYLVLVNLQDPGNLGMILRTADAMGIDGVLLCGCCDIYSPKVVRATMGSLFRVPFWNTCKIETLLPLLHEKKIHTFAAVIDSATQEIRSCDFSAGSAVLIGNEGNGLPDSVSAACNTCMTIPMQGTVNSLNAAMAAGIILWELQGGKR